MSLLAGAAPEILAADVVRYPAGYLVPIRRPDSIAIAFCSIFTLSPIGLQRCATRRNAVTGARSA
jgi:hypothetical protein